MINFAEVWHNACEMYRDAKGVGGYEPTEEMPSRQVKSIARAIVEAINEDLDRIESVCFSAHGEDSL